MAKDKCVSCGAETSYDESVHIDFRDFYVEGAGQFCRSCHSGIRVVNGDNHLVGVVGDFSNEDSREMILVPKSFFRDYPNDSELGGKLREFYYQNY
jgi:hypothetical protein